MTSVSSHVFSTRTIFLSSFQVRRADALDERSSTAPGWFGFGLPREHLLPAAQQSRRRQTALRGLAHSPFARGARGNHISGRAPETSPCRTASRQCNGLDLPKESRRRASDQVGIETHSSRGNSLNSRIVPVRLWLAVRAAQAGDVSTHSHLLIGRRSTAGGPIQRQRGRAADAADRPDTSGSLSHSCRVRWCVRPGVPQFGWQLPPPGRSSHQSIGMCLSCC